MLRTLALATAALLAAALLCWLPDWEALPPAPGPRTPDATPGPTAEMAAGVASETMVEASGVATLDDAVRAVVAGWDPDAREHLSLQVVDERQRPVAGATVRFWGLRSKQGRGTHWSWPRGEEPVARTDRQGEIRQWYPVWIERRHETAVVTVHVGHEQFAAVNQDISIEPGEHTIVLERGTFVTVSGWIGDASRVVTAVTPRVTFTSQVGTRDWILATGRKPSTHKMPVGHHALYLQHDGPDGRYYSDITAFDLAKGTPRDLHLQLHKARTLHGRFDETVPRPVRHGSVIVNLFFASKRALGNREFSAEVATDGSFELPQLPNGTGEITGICDGWVSAKTLPDLTPEDMSGPAPKLVPQPVTMPDHATDFVLAMQAAATVVAKVVGPSGKPVVGATVGMWPNVRWSHGVSDSFMGKTYSATSDDHGIATLHNLPPGDEEYRVVAKGLWMPLRSFRWGAPRRHGALQLRSGETHRIDVRLDHSNQ